MSRQVVEGLGALSFFLTFMLISGFLIFAMIGEANRKLPEINRIPYSGYDFVKYLKISENYRRLYPEGRLVLYFRLSLGLGILFLIAAGWLLGFF